MKLSEVKSILPSLDNVVFQLENGTVIPEHFHVTEVGMIKKQFIDCGGVIREDRTINFQLWNANDTDHRLKPTKLLKIIQLSEEKLGLKDAEVEVEYQGRTIEKYNLGFNGDQFILLAKQTDCLAQDACGIPQDQLPETKKNTCTPGGGCC
ncbi:MAG: DUF6428 family protein [Chitinophagales bacterium]